MKLIPGYVYLDSPFEVDLCQGDVVKVQGELLEIFQKFYPALDHRADRNDQFALILTQSCDLVRRRGSESKPSCNHINVCIVRTLSSHIKREVKTLNKQGLEWNNHQVLPKLAFDGLKDRLAKLINNSESKEHFFLPKCECFPEDMLAILPLSFSFRASEHYKKFIENRVVSLKPEFCAKIGMLISRYYGRVATMDLCTLGWRSDEITDKAQFILNQLRIYGSSSKIKKLKILLKKNHVQAFSTDELDKLDLEIKASENLEAVQPFINEANRTALDLISRLISNDEKRTELLSLSEIERRKAIKKMLLGGS
jgi:hypothetical protein